ncbi:hypothetical protein MHC_01040 [Mycoplasma haemocanis str. Illinois]|uniref:Uncharacterized protein n=1 Tax=Mycoplasma haemocanis (strain Illinois) TaxID=1111676 RepID=H6N602_MYCHN|nr:hypothetical protein [Mycoplasma haemocanis]AEW45074.1 hypothetical protein MHC_01040 [Mycoplasma haemocanis str. Illinois]
MSISIPAKATLGVLAGGATVTGGAFFYKGIFSSKKDSVRSKKPISYLIKAFNNNKRLIKGAEKGDSAEWKAAWKLYAADYRNKGENPFFLVQEKPTTDPNGSESAPKEFMDKCESLSREEVDNVNDSKYQNVLKYCTRDALVRDLISESGRLFFNGDDWKQGWQSYVASNSQNGEDTWKLSDWNNKKNESNYVSDELKKKCESKLSGKVDDEKGDYQNVVNWCSKAK